MSTALARFAGQVGWSLGAKVWNAVLQLVTIVLLARGLTPQAFAWVASVNVVLMAVTATNGFGLMRQLQYRRSIDPDDATLPGLFDLRLWFTYASGALWAVCCVALYLAVDDTRFVAVLPLAVWLALDQTISVWNAISIVDGRTQDLLPSYTLRRLPSVLALVVALAVGWDVLWTWSIALTAGTAVAFVHGRRRQTAWARTVTPRSPRRIGTVPLDLGYWWGEVGAQIRDLDVSVVTAVSATAGGAYALPARLVKPMNMVTLAAASVAFPKLARRPRVTVRELSIGTLVGTVPVTVIAAVAALAAPLVPRIVGEDYSGAVTPFRVLCLAAVLSGFIAVLAIFLQARSTETTRQAGYALFVLGVAQIGTAGLGAHLDGATGAAWGAVAAQAALVVLLAWFAVRRCMAERDVVVRDEVSVDA